MIERLLHVIEEPTDQTGMHEPSAAELLTGVLKKFQDPAAESLSSQTRERIPSLVFFIDSLYHQRAKDPSHDPETLRRAREFFVTPTDRWRGGPLLHLMKRFECLPSANNEQVITLLERMLEHLFLQQEKDPLTFSPHDAAHALLTDDMADVIIEHQPHVIDKMTELYAITPQEARLVLTIVNTMHDCGYPHLFTANGEMISKSTHCVLSADIIRQAVMREAIVGVITSPTARTDRILDDIAQAIMDHSSDVKEEEFTLRIVTDSGVFLSHLNDLPRAVRALTDPSKPMLARRQLRQIQINRSREARPMISACLESLDIDPSSLVIADIPEEADMSGRRIDLTSKRSAEVALPFVPRDSAVNPVLAVLALADNMHAGRERRRAGEDHPVIGKVLQALGDLESSDQTQQALAQIMQELDRKASDLVHRYNGSVSNHLDEMRGLVDTLFTEYNVTQYAPSPDRLTTAVTPQQIIQRCIDAIVDRIIVIHGTDLPSAEKQHLARLGREQIPPNFWHLNGHFAIDQITMEGSTIVIKMADYADQLPQSERIEKLSDEHGQHDYRIPLRYYVAARVASAARSIRFNGQLLDIVIQETNGTRHSIDELIHPAAVATGA